MTGQKKKRGRPKANQEKLTEKTIVESAKVLLKEDSKIPSIRKVAGTLEVAPMAIYHYFPNKNALLERVTTSLMEEIYKPLPDANWIEELTTLCKSYLQLLRDYSGLLEIFLSMSSDGPAQIFTDRFQLILKPYQLTENELQNSLYLLVDYLHGYALAIHCATDKKALSIDMVDGPLNFYIQALRAAIAK